MRLTRLLPVAGAVLALALTTTACGDSSGPNTITLSDAEISQLFSEISDALGQAGIGAERANPSLFLSVVPSFNAAESIDESVTCTKGGSIHVTGNATISADFSSISANVTEAFSACQTTSFTIGGSLTADVSGDLSTSITETLKGTLNVAASDGRSGSCTFDLKLVASQTSATVTGTVCGKDASGIGGLTG